MPETSQRVLTYVDALREAVAQEMRRDPYFCLASTPTTTRRFRVRPEDCWKNSGRSGSSGRRYLKTP
jgi:hypothetical protein